MGPAGADHPVGSVDLVVGRLEGRLRVAVAGTELVGVQRRHVAWSAWACRVSDCNMARVNAISEGVVHSGPCICTFKASKWAGVILLYKLFA